MLSTGVSPKPLYLRALSTRVSPKTCRSRVIYELQLYSGICVVFVCPIMRKGLLMRGQSGARVTDAGSVRSFSVAQVRT